MIAQANTVVNTSRAFCSHRKKGRGGEEGGEKGDMDIFGELLKEGGEGEGNEELFS